MSKSKIAKRIFAGMLAAMLIVTGIVSPPAALTAKAAEDDSITLPIKLYDINKDNMFFEYNNDLYYLFSFVAGNTFQPYAQDMGLDYRVPEDGSADEQHFITKNENGQYQFTAGDHKKADGYIWQDWLNIKNEGKAADFGRISPYQGEAEPVFIRKGLVEDTLGSDGTPVYTESAITYMANAVKLVLDDNHADLNVVNDGNWENLTWTGTPGTYQPYGDDNQFIRALRDQIPHTTVEEEVITVPAGNQLRNSGFDEFRNGEEGSSGDIEVRPDFQNGDTDKDGTWIYHREETGEEPPVKEDPDPAIQTVCKFRPASDNDDATNNWLHLEGPANDGGYISQTFEVTTAANFTITFDRYFVNEASISHDYELNNITQGYSPIPKNNLGTTSGWLTISNSSVWLDNGTYELRFYTAGDPVDIDSIGIESDGGVTTFFNGGFDTDRDGNDISQSNRPDFVNGGTDAAGAWVYQPGTSGGGETGEGGDTGNTEEICRIIDSGEGTQNNWLELQGNADSQNYLAQRFTASATGKMNLGYYYDGAGHTYKVFDVTNQEEPSESAANTPEAGNWVQAQLSFDVEEGHTYELRVYTAGGRAVMDSFVLEYVGPQQTGPRFDYTLGTYEDTAAKAGAGKLTSVGDVATCMDYAYLVMNNFFNPIGGAGGTGPLSYDTDIYDEIELKKVGDLPGYYFVANFDLKNIVDLDSSVENYPVDYDVAERKISNAIHEEDLGAGKNSEQSGFFPLDDSLMISAGKEIGESTTGKIQNKDNGESVQSHNYHYALRSNGSFVYNRSENLFFDFTGDDDVYLFIDGKLVIDIGGAHRSYTEKVNLNELVDNGVLDLEDGRAYSFDFFYLERHTDFANLKINTNIKVMEPKAIVSKTAFDANGTELQDGSMVAAGTEVAYSLTMTNNGTSPIQALHFVDELLGVDIGGKDDAGNFVDEANYKLGETKLSDLSYEVRDGEGVVKYSGQIVERQNENGMNYSLPTLLNAENPYTVGWSLTIKGFKHVINADTINVVTGDVYGQINAGDWMHEDAGEDSHELAVPEGKIFYVWENHDYEQTLYQADDTAIPDNLTIYADQEGNKIIDSSFIELYKGIDGSVKVKVKKKAYGTDLFNGQDKSFTFYTIRTEKEEETERKVATPFYGYAYNVADDFYVLDYGLGVELNDDKHDYGIFQNDSYKNPAVTAGANDGKQNKALFGVRSKANWNADGKYQAGDGGDYGSLNIENYPMNGEGLVTDYNSKENLFNDYDPLYNRFPVRYRINKFMNDLDHFVYGTGVSGGTEATTVEMQANVTFAPASVVYYEDDFNRNTETGDAGVKIIYTGNTSTDGVSVDVLQSNDQDEQYGHDDAYENGNIGAGGGSSTKMEAGATATFTFKGTGFDIISRTNDKTAAVYVTVKDESGKTVGRRLVDTYYNNGDLYQIPVISVTDLEHGTYTVTIQIKQAVAVEKDEYGNAIVGSGTERTTVYLDGIRIYNPLGIEDGDDITDNNQNGKDDGNGYLEEEYGAVIEEIRNMILGSDGKGSDGKVALAWPDMTDDSNGNLNVIYSGGFTTVENLGIPGGEDSVSKPMSVDSLGNYLRLGPNNEVYLADGEAIAFLVTPEDGKEPSLQIEAKALKESSQDEVSLALLDLDPEQEELSGKFIDVQSNTAMYVRIPLSEAIQNTDGSYLVVLMANNNSGDEFDAVPLLSLTNLKYKNCRISVPALHDMPEDDGEDGLFVNDLYHTRSMPEVISVAMRLAVKPESVLKYTKDITADGLTVNSLNAKAGKKATAVLKTGGDTEGIVILDENKQKVNLSSCSKKVTGSGTNNFNFSFTAPKKKGTYLYTAYSVDDRGYYSDEGKTIKVVVK